VTGRWFSLGTLVSSTNKSDRHIIAEILLKVALNTINQTYRQSMAITTIVMSLNNTHGEFDSTTLCNKVFL